MYLRVLCGDRFLRAARLKRNPRLLHIDRESGMQYLGPSVFLSLVCGSSITTAMRRGSIPEMTVRYRSSRPIFSPSSEALPPHIFFFFQRPCLNRIALATAIEDSAMAIEKKTPFDRMCNGIASQ